MAGGGPSRQDPSGEGPELSTLLAIGGAVAGCVIVGLGVGWFVDGRVHTFPIFALVGLAVGIAAAAAYLYAKFSKYLRQ
jgi:F0F1-type ATP synthase assembly protein I